MLTPLHKREFAGLACEWTLLPSGNLAILFIYGPNNCGVEVFDPEFRTLHSFPVRGDTVDIWAEASGEIGLLAPDEIEYCSESGGDWRYVRPGLARGLEFRAALLVDGGYILIAQHAYQRDLLAPELTRLRADGEVLWRTRLPVPLVDYGAPMEANASEGWVMRPSDPYEPTAWLLWGDFAQSGDRLAVNFAEDPRTGLGSFYGLDINTGAIEYRTHIAPFHHCVAAGNGEFLLGAAGYDDFETIRVNRFGIALDRWATAGHAVLHDGLTYLVETTNDNKLHPLVELVAGGVVQRGDTLPPGQASEPCVMPDGSMYFFCEGRFCHARGLRLEAADTVEGIDKNWYNVTPILRTANDLYLLFYSRRFDASSASSLTIRIRIP